jgi:hypothetical protein
MIVIVIMHGIIVYSAPRTVPGTLAVLKYLLTANKWIHYSLLLKAKNIKTKK